MPSGCKNELIFLSSDFAVTREFSMETIQTNSDAMQSVRCLLADPDRSDEVARIRCPTLIIHGADDPLIPVPAAHHLARLLPHARLEVIPRLGHYLPASALPELARLTIEHLRSEKNN